MLRRITRWYIVSPVILFCLMFMTFHSTVASDIASNYSVHSEVIKEVAGLKVSIDLAWTLLCGFLVFNMQAGFAFLGAGFLQKKNTLNYLTMSFMDFCVGGLIFWAFGFALMFGGSFLAFGLDAGNTLIGYSGYFLSFGSFDYSTSKLWLFQMWIITF